MTNWSWTKGEGEARGRRLRFSYDGWDSRYNYMTDASGQKLATFEPVGWWGTQFKLLYDGKGYGWKVNGWGTTFSILDGETEIIRVFQGGYFKPGSITVNRAMDEKDLLPLILYGLYQMQIYASNSSSAASGAAIVPASS